MKKPFPIIWTVSILMLLLNGNPAWAASTKTRVLEQKLSEISSIQAKIIDKIDQALEMQTRLEHQLATMQDEIRSEQIREAIHSYQEAMQNLRIRYNLCLVQILMAYIEKLDERIAYFQNGDEQLKFLVYRIKDDMAIIHVLKDMEIDHLTERTNRVLAEFGPEIQKPVFNVTDIHKFNSEHIWEQIRTGSQLN